MSKYFYGGVGPLPDIYSVYTPELQETHPFAVIWQSSAGLYRLCATDKAASVSWTVVGDKLFFSETSSDLCSVWEADESATDWTISKISPDHSDQEAMNCYARELIWSNYDIYYADDYRADSELNGTLYLAASDPVPVLSTDHTAMVQGWIVGKRLAGMRGKA